MSTRSQRDDLYLDFAMREYLAMRDEMNKNLAQNFTLILGALVGAGAIGAAVGFEIVSSSTAERGLLLLLVGAFGFLVFLGAIGQLNGFKILERYVCRSAEDIRHRLGAGDDQLLSLQHDVDIFNQHAFTWTPSGRAWIASYGAVSVVGVFTFLMLGGIVLAGAVIAVSGSGWPGLPEVVLITFDSFLIVATLAMAAFSARHQPDWDDLFPGPPRPASASTPRAERHVADARDDDAAARD